MTPRFKILPLIFLLGFSSTAFAGELHNELAGNPSPYLAMHASDPTAWQSWSRKSVELARKQNKLLFVSVGYYSCRWCHVMQRESYRNAKIAEYINAHYVPVKVDREIDAALDAYLIAFAERTQGYSGWPLNVFMTPDGYPLFATVYQPPDKFLQILQRMQALWTQSPDELKRLAADAQPHGNGPGKPVKQVSEAKALSKAVANVALKIGAPLNGGFGSANKFPLSPQLEYLLDQVSGHENRSLREFIALTLDNMARYGLRDHLGGGFFRYTVDPGWRTPHFEKMLYDNAQLAAVYMKAAKVYRNQHYQNIAKQTLDFMKSRMVDSSGALIASYSAIDSHEVEGGYYLWQKQEIKKLLDTEEWQVYRRYAGLNDPSPLDDGYLPMEMVTPEEISLQLHMPEARVRTLVRSSEQKLLRQRMKRKPVPDTKLLAGWNGLALTTFCRAAKQFNNPEYRQVAQGIRDYLVSSLWDGRRLLRAKVDGKPVGQVSLQDYAYVARGLLDWASLTKNKEDYKLAQTVMQQAWKRFYGKHGWNLSESGFIPMEAPVDVIADDSTPSASAIVISTSYEIANELDDDGLRRQALSAANSGQSLIKSDPFWYVSEIHAIQVTSR